MRWGRVLAGMCAGCDGVLGAAIVGGGGGGGGGGVLRIGEVVGMGMGRGGEVRRGCWLVLGKRKKKGTTLVGMR